MSLFHPLHNIQQFFERIGHYNQNPVRQNDFCQFVHFPESVWPNFFYELKFDSFSLDKMDELLSQMKLPAHLLCIEDDIPPAFFKEFKSNCLQYRTWQSMTYKLVKPIDFDYPSGLEIKTVENLEDFNAWFKVCKSSLFMERNMSYELFKALFQKAEFEFFLASYEKKPVAVSLLFKENNNAGVYFVGSLSEYRKRGFGTAVTAKAMEAGREKGCSQAILQATELGEPVYAKLGFENRGLISIFKFY